jgi:autotransporter-associated beta strand protein
MKPRASIPFQGLAILAACICAALPGARAATFTWDGGDATSNSWGSANNWDPDGAPTFNNEADLLFNVLARTNNFIGNHRTIRSISYGPDIDDTFQTNYQDFNGGAARNLTMDADSGNASITVDADATGNISLGTVTGAAGSIGTMSLADDLDIIHNGSGLLLFNRAIGGVGFGITKTGTGTVQTNNFNTFTGPINLNEGTLIANTFGADGQDLNAASAVNLEGGTLEIRASSGISKSYATVPVNVNSASTLVYNNVNATTFTAQFTGTNPFVLNADLTVRNISANTSVVNAFNVTRPITGSGNITVESYQNVASTADNFSIGRFLLGGDNSGWSGNLTIAKGTVSLSGNAVNAAGTGTITLGTTADTFGAGLTFFPTGPNGSTATYANEITVTSGGFRAIKGGNTNHNITFDGNVTLHGSLTLDHTLSAAERRLSVNGTISGNGGLTITKVGGHAETTARLGAVNTYTGPTLVTTGASLALANGSSLVSNVTVQSGARIGGSGASTSGNLTLEAGANFFFFYSLSYAPFSVGGTLTLDSSFGIASLVGGSRGEPMPWSTIPDGSYVLIQNPAGNFSHIQNFGVANAVEVEPGRSAYFENNNGLQLVIASESANPYDTWSGGAAFTDDSNNDGIDNGLAWFLGAADKDVNASALLPKVTQTAGALVLEFDCLAAADRGTATFAVQHSSDLGQLDAWAETAVPGVVGSHTAGVVDFEITAPAPAGGLLKVVATIPATETAAGKVFARIVANP